MGVFVQTHPLASPAGLDSFEKPTPCPLPCPYLAKEDSLPAWEGEKVIEFNSKGGLAAPFVNPLYCGFLAVGGYQRGERQLPPLE